MSDVIRLTRLAIASAKNQVRATMLPKQQAEAQEEFVRVLGEGGTSEEIEAARMKCSAIFDMQLDLCIEHARISREYLEEAGRD